MRHPAEPAPGEALASRKSAVYIALGLQTVISAGTYLAAKRALAEVDPFTVVICRFALSGLGFLLLLALTPGRFWPPRSAWRTFLYLGFLAGPLNQGLLFYGLTKSSAAHAALFYALTPAGVYLLALIRRQESFSVRAMRGIVLAFAGALILLLDRGLAESKGPLLGDVLILGAVVAWVLFTVDGAPEVARYGAVRATSWSMVFATLLTLPTAPFLFHSRALHSATSTVIGCILYLAILTSIVSYLLWYYALSKTVASKVAVFANLQPVATALAARLLLNEPLTWEIAVGGILVLWGVRLTQAV